MADSRSGSFRAHRPLAFLGLVALLLAACSSDPRGAPDPDPEPEPSTGIVGTVVDEGGDPVAGARVEAVPTDAEPDEDGDVDAYLRTAETEADGSFRIDIEHRGRYNLVVHAGALGGADIEVEASGTGTIRIAITVESTGAIEGQVNPEGLADALGVEVFIPGTTFIARTDASGAFRLDGVPAGDWTVVMEHDGFARAEVDATVSAGDTVTLAPVPLAPIEPIAITSFTADPTSGAAPLDVAFAWEASDPSGAEIECRLDVNGDGIAEHEGGCVVDAFEHTFEEVGTHRAELRVRAPRQTASASLAITVSEEATEPTGFASRQQLGTTNPTGEAAFFYDRMDTTDEIAVIGSPGMSTTTFTPRGTADYYLRNDDGSWSFGGSILPPAGTSSYRYFGAHATLSGSTLVIAAERRLDGASDFEAVLYSYEFEEATGGWSAPQVLLEGEGLALFGVMSIDLQGDVLAVGVAQSPSSSTSPAGPSVRVFERPDASSPWVETDPIPWHARPDGRSGETFGTDVDVDPDGLAIAVADAVRDDDSGTGQGVFLFERADAGSPWVQSAVYDASELPARFGVMVEVAGDALFVTPMAMREIREADVFVFERDEGGPNAWGHASTLRLEVATHERMTPYNILMSTEFLAGTFVAGIGPVDCYGGVPGDRCVGGRVFVFERSPAASNAWTEVQVIEDRHGADSSRFGEFVSLSATGGTLIAGGTVDDHDYTFAEVLSRE